MALVHCWTVGLRLRLRLGPMLPRLHVCMFHLHCNKGSGELFREGDREGFGRLEVLHRVLGVLRRVLHRVTEPLHRVLGPLHRVLGVLDIGVLHRVPDVLVPCVVHLVPCGVHLGPCVVPLVPCVVPPVRCVVHLVPCVVHLVPCVVLLVFLSHAGKGSRAFRGGKQRNWGIRER